MLANPSIAVSVQVKAYVLGPSMLDFVFFWENLLVSRIFVGFIDDVDELVGDEYVFSFCVNVNDVLA